MTEQLTLLTLRWVELSRDGNTMEDGRGIGEEGRRRS